MILVAVAVLGATSIGLFCERHFAAARVVARRILTLMLYVLVPFVSFVNIAHLQVTLATGLGLTFGYAAVFTAGGLAWAIGRFRLRLTERNLGAVICTVIVVNTGYLGLPMSVALLHPGALGSAIAYDQLVSGPSLFLLGFGVGAAFGDPGDSTTRVRGRRPSGRLRRFVTRNPPLVAVTAGLLAPAWLAPDPLPAISHAVVAGLLVLGFFTVGVNLAAERSADGARLLERPDGPVLLALGLRLAVAPLVVIALSLLTVRVPSAYMLQAAMPTGISALIVGHAYRLNQRMIATIIVWSTAIVLTGGLVAATL